MEQIIAQNMEVVERLFQILEEDSHNLNMYYELTWVIVNLCCMPDQYTSYFIEKFQALRTIVFCFQRCSQLQLDLNSSTPIDNTEMYSQLMLLEQIKGNCLWALSNICADNSKAKEIVLKDLQFCSILKESLYN